mgnify:CR=1 FL=1
MFRNKYYDINIDNIIDILESDVHDKIKKEIKGFFNYKLYGLKNFGIDEIDVLGILKSHQKN